MSEVAVKPGFGAAAVSAPAARTGERERQDLEPEARRQPLAADEAQLQVHALSSDELAWIEARKTARPLSTTPPTPVFAKEGEDNPFGALRPFYREPTLERVQLQFEDKSLDPAANPLALSSLLPPSKSRLEFGQWLIVGVGGLALISVGYLAAVATRLDEQGSSSTTALAAARNPEGSSNPNVIIETLTPPPELVQPSSPTPTREVPWSVAGGLGTAQPASEARPSASDGDTGARDDAAKSARGAQSVAPHVRLSAAARAAAARQARLLLPAQPSRDQIKAAVENARTALQACAGNAHGTSTARINIVGNGRVASALIEGAFAGTPQGSCMARALRATSFPAFASENLQVTYPFRL
jgi:hypothetical protein